MTIKRHSEAEPKNPRKVQHNDWILHSASAPFRMTTGHGSLKKIATSAFRLLAMTISALAFIFTLITTAESWAACDNGNPYGYMKDGTCVSCPSMPGYCYWDEEQGKAIMTGCDSRYGYGLKNGRCVKVMTCVEKYGPCSECSYNEDDFPIACIKCNSGFKAKNGTCLWGAPGTSCGDGYVDGDGVCYKIPDGCDLVVNNICYNFKHES